VTLTALRCRRAQPWAESPRRWARAAASRWTRPDVLAEMARRPVPDPGLCPLWALAANPACPPATLMALAGRDLVAADTMVRAAAAGNPNTPVEALACLAADLSPHVRSVVAARADVDADVLVVLAGGGGSPAVAAARHPNHTAWSRAAAGFLAD